MSWCWGKSTSVICWRITRPTTTGCARTLRSTRMLHSIDLRRQSGLSHQSLGSAVSIGTTFGWHNRYTQVEAGAGNNGGTPTATGTLTVIDPDNGQSAFQIENNVATT